MKIRIQAGFFLYKLTQHFVPEFFYAFIFPMEVLCFRESPNLSIFARMTLKGSHAFFIYLKCL